MKLSIFLGLFLLFSISFSSGLDVSNGHSVSGVNIIPPVAAVNYSAVNTNNSVFWDGNPYNSTRWLPTIGGTMSGAINMGNQNIINVSAISIGRDITNGGLLEAYSDSGAANAWITGDGQRANVIISSGDDAGDDKFSRLLYYRGANLKWAVGLNESANDNLYFGTGSSFTTPTLTLTTSGNVGVGVDDPTQSFEVAGNGRFGAGNLSFPSGHVAIVTNNNAGTMSLVNDDASIFNGNNLGAIYFAGTDTADYISSMIKSVAHNAWTGSSRASNIEFYTTALGSTTMTKKMALTSAGHLITGASNEDIGNLNVVGVNENPSANIIREDATITAGEVIGALWFYGTDDADSYSGGIRIKSVTDWSASNSDGELEFFTTNTGSTSVTRKALLSQDGNFQTDDGKIIANKDTGGVFDATTISAEFGDLDSFDNMYFTGNTINGAKGFNADTGVWFNYVGYNGGNTRFRNFHIADGKNNQIAKFEASSGNFEMSKDNGKLLFGAGKNNSITHDGSNMIINPKEAGNGIVKVTGSLNSTENIHADGNITGAGLILNQGETMTWNSDYYTLNVPTGLGNTIQVGQELTLIRKNNAGQTLYAGQLVTSTGTTGEITLVKLADTSNGSLIHDIGMVTLPSCNDNAVCSITYFGDVNDIDTSAYAEGTTLYLSDDGSGNVTDVLPSGDSYHIHIGKVTRSHASTGIIEFHTEIDYADEPVINNLKVLNNVNVSGNVTGDFFYGEIWNSTMAGATHTIAGAGQWINVTTGVVCGSINGFTCNNGVLTSLVSGTFKLEHSLSFDSVGGDNDEFISAPAINDNPQQNCYAFRDTGTGSAIGSKTMSCMISVSVGDALTFQVQNVDDGDDLHIHQLNMNLMRVGD